LRPALEFGLDIFDRAGGDDPQFRWPEPYAAAVRGSLPYVRMLQAYRCYKVGLNLNTVTDSPTMLSRRVFELLAAGTPVVSSDALAIAELLGGDLVLVSGDGSTTREHLRRLLSDENHRQKRAVLGTRRVFAHHTYSHRLDQILGAVGLGGRKPLVAVDVVAPVESREAARRAREQFFGQRFPAKGDLLLCARDGLALGGVDGGIPGVRTCVGEGDDWGKILAETLRSARAPWIALIHPDHYYAPHYLTDQAQARLYSKCRVIGKRDVFLLDGAGRLRRLTEVPGNASGPPAWTLLLEAECARELSKRASDARSLSEWSQRISSAIDDFCSTHPFDCVLCEAPGMGGSAAERDAFESATA
jgi:hypothetical protein